MARKHAKKFSKKMPVQQILVSPATDERRVVTGENGEFVIIKGKPAVYKQGKAMGSTQVGRGKPNTGGAKAGVKKPKEQ